MDTQPNQNSSFARMGGWHIPPWIWFTCALLAVFFDTGSALLNVLMPDISGNATHTDPTTKLALTIGGIAIAALFKAFFVWRRWANADLRPTRYIVWTVLQSLLILPELVGLLFSVLLLPSLSQKYSGLLGQLSGASNVVPIFIGVITLSAFGLLFWIVNTLAIPLRATQQMRPNSY
jgi:hypothetical protein